MSEPIQLPGGFFDHEMWGEQRPFSRAEAFLDLVHQAMDSPPEVEVSGFTVKLGPGQLCTSLRLLSFRWQWSTTRIRNFLTMLENQKLVERIQSELMNPENTPRSDNPPTTITIRKFNRFRIPAPAPPEEVKNTPLETTPAKRPKRPTEGDPAKWARMSHTVKKTTTVEGNTPLMERMGRWFGQRPTTLWTVLEAETLFRVNPPGDELDLIEGYYLAMIDKESDMRRKDMITLLNNWRGETQRATGWKADQ